MAEYYTDHYTEVKPSPSTSTTDRDLSTRALPTGGPGSPEKTNFTARYKNRAPEMCGNMGKMRPGAMVGARRAQFPTLSRFVRDMMTIPGMFLSCGLLVRSENQQVLLLLWSVSFQVVGTQSRCGGQV
jgi:hypothetical protein